MPRPSRLSVIALTDLRSELDRRQRRAGTLAKRRDRLLAQAAAIDRELAALGAAPATRRTGVARRGRPPEAAGRRGGRPGPRSGATLPNTLARVLGDRVMTVTEAVAAVKKAGFKTKASAKSLYGMVAIALTRGGRFRRVARGRYRAR